MALLAKYKNFILDCDGVLWGSKPIPGSFETLEALRKAGKSVVFVTNNSSKSRRLYGNKFKAFGCEVDPESINTSGAATAAFVKEKGYKKVFMVGAPGFREELEGQGVAVVEAPANDQLGKVDNAAFAQSKLDVDVDAVVCGYDQRFSFHKLVLASLYIQAGAPLIATNQDAYDTVDGKNIPGNGCQVAAIERSLKSPTDDPYAEDKRTITCGKPSPQFMESILTKYNYEREETLMIGDRIDTDIRFGNSCNVDTLLVLSGATTADEAQKASAEDLSRPTYVLQDLKSILSTNPTTYRSASSLE